jgi:hypothetical protein
MGGGGGNGSSAAGGAPPKQQAGPSAAAAGAAGQLSGQRQHQQQHQQQAAPAAGPFEPLAVPPKIVPSLSSDKSLRVLLKKYCLPSDGKKKVSSCAMHKCSHAPGISAGVPALLGSFRAALPPH